MNFIASYFRFEELNTNWRAEFTGGLTTFMTMAYIVAVNPGILSEAMGQSLFGELLFATCVSAAFGTLLMALLANYPFALAPGMGLNAFFTYTIVLGMGVDWRIALAVVLASGILFLLLTFLRVREAIITAVPEPLKRATAAGIGLFIAFIGLKNAGVIVDDPATLVSLGDVRSWPVGLTLAGMLAMGVMLARGMRGSILLGVAGIAFLAMVFGVTPWPAGVAGMPTWPSTLFGEAVVNLPLTLDSAILHLVFAFLFVDLFDTMGTLVGLSERSGFLDRQGRLPRANRALLADSVGTVFGSVMGSATVTTYIESATGISSGARTGFASLVVAFLFLGTLFLTPLVESIPVFATAPALIVTGVLMMASAARVNWSDASEAVPVFLTLISIPLTFSIADGLAVGFVAYPVIKRLSGRGGEVHPLVDVLALVFIARYVFMT